MRPLRYSINITLDGCCDHRSVVPTEEMHRYAMEMIAAADALLFGRVTYQMMESAWRQSPAAGSEPAASEEMPEWTRPFARVIDAAPKYVVSSTLESVDWNAELVRGDLRAAVEDLKNQPGEGIYVGGVQLPLALAGWGLIDEYEFIVHPRLIGHGPTIFAGLQDVVDLRPTGRVEFDYGAVALRYAPA